jgi:hypothetical protein
VNQVNQSRWVPGVNIAQDETMIPHKGHRNPHHMFIRGKPHPNGLKATTMADASRYMYSVVLCRRTNEDEGEKMDPIMLSPLPRRWRRGPLLPPKKVHDMVKEVAASLPPGRHLYGDSYYGGLPVIETLAKMGHQATYTCSSNRPATIFHPLKAMLTTFGSSASSSGYYEVTLEGEREEIEPNNGGDDDLEEVDEDDEVVAATADVESDEGEQSDDTDDVEDAEDAEDDAESDESEEESDENSDSEEDPPESLTIHFAACAFQAARPMYLLSTGHPAGSSVMAEEEVESGRGKSKVRVRVPEARKAYNVHMHYVDDVNKEVLTHRFPHRYRRWKAALGMFYIRLLINNARVVYTTNNGHVSTKRFLKGLISALAPLPRRPGLHILKSQRSKSGKCFVCRKRGRNSSTTSKCQTCGKWVHPDPRCANSLGHR